MNHVKHVFGLLIILIGLYYGIQAWKIYFPEQSPEDKSKLYTALIESKKSGKPVFVDFYADWCKNCIAMDKTTFQDPAVKEKLKSYEFVKIDATNTSDPNIKKLLDLYGIKGLPAFLILNVE